MKKLNIILLSLFAACASTSTDYTVITYDDFQKTEFLQASDVQLDSMDYGVDFSIVDSVLLFNNIASDHLLSAYNLYTGKKIKSFLNKGRADNELLGEPFVFVSNSNGVIAFTEPLGLKALFYSYDALKNIKKQDEPQPIQTVKTTIPNYGISLLGKDRLVAMPIEVECTNRLYFMDGKGDSLFYASSCPKTNEMTFSEDKNHLAFDAKLIVNNEKERLYLFNKRMDVIEIYNFAGERIKLIKGPIGCLPQGDMERFKDSYFNPISKNNSIWVIFKGVSPSETQESSLSKILKFDSDGVPQKIYELDKAIIRFDIDEKNHSIYATVEENGEIRFVKFKYNS